MAWAWPPFGRQWLHFAYFWVPFRKPCFLRFLILFRTHQNLDFAILYNVLEGFSHPKSSHFGTPFRSLFRYHFGTPFGRAFWATLAPKGADLASPCRFWTLFGTPPGVQNGPRGAQGLPKTVHKRGPENDPCPQGVPRAILIDFWIPLVTKAPFWEPLGWHKARFGTPLGDLGLDFPRNFGLE